MKILFVMDTPEYLRFYDSAIEELAARGHSVAIAVNHFNAKKPVGLKGLTAYADRVRVLGVVPSHDGMWGDIAFGLRGTMDFMRFLHPRFAVARALRVRIKRKVLPVAYHWLDAIPRLPPSAVRAAERALMAAERAIPLCDPMVEFLRAQKPDVLLVSPLVDAASRQVDWVKAAQALGIRTAVCVASWDNLTNKGLIRIEPELVIVWNEAQKQEAREYHYIPDEKIVVTGAQLFDRWFVKRMTRNRSEFCARVGLPDTRPFLLFTGSSSFISESNAEVAFVRRWEAALRSSSDATLREANVLVRPHPYNFHMWGTEPMADRPGVAVFPGAGYNPIEAESRTDFFDSIYHAAAVVGINTSAMIEAAIIGRPVFSMSAEEFSGTQEGTIHFHHLLPENGGCVRIASTLDEHIRQLSERLLDPDAAFAETQRFIASFIRPHGIDLPATPVFADAVERLAAAAAPRPKGQPWWGYGVRPVVLSGALVGFVGNWLHRPDPLKPVRRHVSRVVRHRRKAIERVAAKASSRTQRRVKLVRKRWQKSVVKPMKARWS